MKRVNRCILLVRPLAPYLEWASGISNTEFIDEDDAEVIASAYLLPDLEDETHAETLVSRHAQAIFRSELTQWHEDESRWPDALNFDTLLQWFDIDLVPLVMDLGTAPLKELPIEE